MAGDKQERTVDIAARVADRMAKRFLVFADRWGVKRNA